MADRTGSTTNTTTTMSHTVAGVFHSSSDAEKALNALKDAGFSPDQVSVVAKDTGETKTMVEHSDMAGAETTGAGAGALLGGITGGIAGWLVGIGALAIPGIGPIVAAGALATTLGGAAVGAVAGGLIGALVGRGHPRRGCSELRDARPRGSHPDHGAGGHRPAGPGGSRRLRSVRRRRRPCLRPERGGEHDPPLILRSRFRASRRYPARGRLEPRPVPPPGPRLLGGLTTSLPRTRASRCRLGARRRPRARHWKRWSTWTSNRHYTRGCASSDRTAATTARSSGTTTGPSTSEVGRFRLARSSASTETGSTWTGWCHPPRRTGSCQRRRSSLRAVAGGAT